MKYRITIEEVYEKETDTTYDRETFKQVYQQTVNDLSIPAITVLVNTDNS